MFQNREPKVMWILYVFILVYFECLDRHRVHHVCGYDVDFTGAFLDHKVCMTVVGFVVAYQ